MESIEIIRKSMRNRNELNKEKLEQMINNIYYTLTYSLEENLQENKKDFSPETKKCLLGIIEESFFKRDVKMTTIGLKKSKDRFIRGNVYDYLTIDKEKQYIIDKENGWLVDEDGNEFNHYRRNEAFY